MSRVILRQPRRSTSKRRARSKEISWRRESRSPTAPTSRAASTCSARKGRTGIGRCPPSLRSPIWYASNVALKTAFKGLSSVATAPTEDVYSSKTLGKFLSFVFSRSGAELIDLGPVIGSNIASLRDRFYVGACRRRAVLQSRDIDNLFAGLQLSDSVLMRSGVREVLYHKRSA